jgi:glycosyltransferase involved in cell wall biosynthesis
MKLVSVIIPCYNSSRYLAKSIDSALAQTHPNKEIIVVDDGSTDESPMIMSRYGDRIRVIQQANAGLSAARNAGIRHANGKYVAFLDSDDWWEPDFLMETATALESSDATIAYCGWQNIGMPPPYDQPFVPEDYEKSLPSKTIRLLRNTGWPVHAALSRKDKVIEAGLFNPLLKSCEDFALWIRIATRHTIVRIPKVLAYYRFHDQQMSTNQARIALAHYAVQKDFLAEHPEILEHAGNEQYRNLTSGELLKRGYKAYWNRDISAARAIFRRVMLDGYGKLADWKYMLPSLLPLPVHTRLIKLLEQGRGASPALLPKAETVTVADGGIASCPPSVSIIMPCYNAASHLPTSIGSVFAQTYADWELIVVDDGSSDDSWKELQRFASLDSRIRIFRQKNAGPATARNFGLHQAQGAYTAFLDADDTWHPEFLSVMKPTLDQAPEAAIAYCGWQNLGLGGGRDNPFIPPDYENSAKLESLLGGCRWPIHAALVHTQTILDIGGFDETLSSCMDFDLWLRLGTVHQLIRVPDILAYYHHGTGQITANKARIALNHWRVQKKFLSLNPAARQNLGKVKIDSLMDGELLKRGYEAYWKRDIPTARKIFRAVMAHGYGSTKDWKHMLPSLLPLSLHQALVRTLSRSQFQKPHIDKK